MKPFEELNQDELWELRKEIILNSPYIADYRNSFGYDARDICDFFDGYVEFLFEEAKYWGFQGDDISIINEFDTSYNLLSWAYCFDDLSWVRMSDFDENEEVIPSWWTNQE